MDNYAVRNLSSSLENLKDDMTKKKAMEIVKYQNFKTRIALERMDVKMARQVFDSAVGYIRYKTHNPSIVTKSLKEAIDECIANHVQPLTPKEHEKRQVYARRSEVQRLIKESKKYHSKDAVPPIAKLEIVKQPVVENFEYGVKQGDNIRLFKTETEAQFFINNASFFSREPLKLVEVTINERE